VRKTTKIAVYGRMGAARTSTRGKREAVKSGTILEVQELKE
jgi:hypothetical protein